MYICVILRQGQKILVPFERNITSDTLKGLIKKSSCIISGEVLVCTLKISIGSACRLLWCIETELSFSNTFEWR